MRSRASASVVLKMSVHHSPSFSHGTFRVQTPFVILALVVMWFIGLLRNRIHDRLLWRKLETKSSGLFLQTTKQVIAVFLFVVAFAGVTVLLAVFEHSIDYSSELVCDSFYGR